MITTQLPEPDLTAITPAEAGRIFNDRVTMLEKSGVGDYPRCIESAKLRWPNLHARMISSDRQLHSPKPVVVSNSAIEIPPEPVAEPQFKSMLGLPLDATPEEFSTAWKATKGITTPRNSVAIFAALVTLKMNSDKVDRVEASRRVTERCPLLANELFPKH